MSPIYSTREFAALIDAAVLGGRLRELERRRTAMRRALTAYAGRLRRLYGIPAPQPR
jgi:hypothetical protein